MIGLVLHRLFDGTLQLLHAISWPIAIIVLIVWFHKPIRDVLQRLYSLEAPGIKMVLQRAGLSDGSLGGLSAHDIWALDSFETQQIPLVINQLNAPQKVMASSLIELRLLTTTGDGPNRTVSVTPLGHRILEAARSLLS